MSKDDGQQKPPMMRLVRRRQALAVFVTTLALTASFVLALAAWSRILLWTEIIDWIVDDTDSIALDVALQVVWVGIPALLSFRAAKIAYATTRWREVEWDGSRCLECEYDLTGNVSGRCPECGWEIPMRSEGEVA